MQNLIERLRSALNDGFCYHSLNRVAKRSFQALHDEAGGWTSEDYLVIHAIGSACRYVCDTLDSAAPISTDRHNAIEAVVAPELEKAIAALSKRELQEEILVSANLLRAALRP